MANPYTDEIREARKRLGEGNDCTCVALSVVTGNTIEQCYQYMAKYGRRKNRGMLTKEIDTALKGMKKFYAKKGDIKYGNINKFIREHPVGRYYCCCRGHAFAIIDGELYDHNPSTRRFVQDAWRIYTKEEVEKLRKGL